MRFRPLRSKLAGVETAGIPNATHWAGHDEGEDSFLDLDTA